jgi:hypothetical protein
MPTNTKQLSQYIREQFPGRLFVVAMQEQLNGFRVYVMRRCPQYVKDTILKANYNNPQMITHNHAGVPNMSKIQF